jgi:3-phosphoshikimate 1-carboxyvinyltransferase
VDGSLTPPPSKSHTHRAIILASLAKGSSVVKRPLSSADITSTEDSMRSLGADIVRDGDSILIRGGNLHIPMSPVDAGNSGTTMRLVAGLSATFDGPITITGDASLRKRPMSPLLDALGSMGAVCSSSSGFPPVTVRGPIRGCGVSIDGSVSSQFISSLMIASPLLKDDTQITIEGAEVSKPYLDVTSRMMGCFGASSKISGRQIQIRGGSGYRPCEYTVPADFSSAAFPLVAGALCGKVSVNGMDMSDPQGDKRIVDIIREAGAKVDVRGDTVTCEHSELHAADVDMCDIPDLFPILSVLFSTAEGVTRLHGAPQLRHKESDRIETVVTMMRHLGADIKGTDDGCIINGVGRLRGGTVDNAGDHRIMMSAAVASLICEGPIVMDDAECCSISYPQFIQQMRSIGMEAV